MVAEIGTIGIAAAALVISIFAFRKQLQSNISHSVQEPTIFRRSKKKPVVRDDLAAWRQEEKERFEWEQNLKEKMRNE
jgi:hypothetical protein